MKLSTHMLGIAIVLLSLAVGSFAKAWQHEKRVNEMLVEMNKQISSELSKAQQHPTFGYDCSLGECAPPITGVWTYTPHNNESPTDPTPSGRKQ